MAEYDSKIVATLFVESIKPYWSWWIEDYGGSHELIRICEDWFHDGFWFIAELNDEAVGITGFFQHKNNYYGIFYGVMVHPKYRMRGAGSTLMDFVLKRAKEEGLKKLRVYTMAFLNRLAPGAILYLKSGGKVSVEYIHLEKFI